MALTSSTMLSLGLKAPDFALKNASGKKVGLADYKDSPALLFIFICNHCPYVRHIIKPLRDLIEEFQKKGVSVLAINSNDISAYPEDAPDNMQKWAKELNFTFPFLFDESQEVAKSFLAACTPDFFLFNNKLELVYRGQFDNSRPGNYLPVNGEDLRQALEGVLSGKPPLKKQRPSLGCNIKWKKGNEPDYY